MDFFSAMEVIASGLTAERVRMNTTASNLANVNTTRTAEGGPYQRLDPVFKTTPVPGQDVGFETQLDRAIRGVEVSDVVADTGDPRRLFKPEHPDADEAGYVELPNVNMLEEMVNMITAARSYEAGVTAMQQLVEMAQRALSLGR